MWRRRRRVDHGAGAAAYAASKAAAVAMMDSLAADVKGSGVRVNSILPEHHRYGGESEGDAGCGFCAVAEAGGYCEGDSVLVQ